MVNEQLFIKMGLEGWNGYLKRAGDLFNSLTDEQLAQETAPGKNTGTYLLGHLIAVHDRMIELMFLGERLYPELDEPYLKNPESAGLAKLDIPTLRGYWNTLNEKLAADFANMKPEDWFARHSAVSEEDFAKEPHRNRLNLVMNRASHIAWHYGQVLYLKVK